MKASMKSKRGVVGAAVLASILAVGGYALTNTITFATKTTAGYGEQALEHVNVTATHWVLTTGDPTTVDSVTFTYDPIVFGTAGAAAWFNVNDTPTWKACTDIAGGSQTSVVCTFTTPVKVQDLGEVGYANAVDANSVAGTQLSNIDLVVAEK